MEYKIHTNKLIYSGNDFELISGKNLDTGKSAMLEFHENHVPLYANLEIQGKPRGTGKYAKTILVQSFDFILTRNKVDMVSYLSQPDFKGVGKKTAEKIIDAYEPYLQGTDKEIDKEIIGNPEPLFKILGYEKGMNFRDKLVSKTGDLKLQQELLKMGVNSKFVNKFFASLRSKKLNNKQIKEIIYGNLYHWSFENDNLNFAFKDIDEMVYKVNKDLWLKEHYKWVILGDLKQYFFNTGNTWVSVNEFGRMQMRQMSKQDFEKNVVSLVKERAIKLTDHNQRMTFATFYYKELENAEILARSSVRQHNTYFEEDIEKAIKNVENDMFEFHYDEEQKDAIKKMMNSRLMLLQGLAGTGKSKVVQGMVKTYLEMKNLNSFVDKDSVVLLAPTGKAATRLNEIDNSFEARTIHSFLGLNPFANTQILTPEQEQLEKKKCGLVIVDEASMLDIFTLNMLLKRIEFDKLVFVGDINQLPSVNVGDVLWDMEESKLIPEVKLKTIHRASEDSGVITLANAIARNEIHNQNDIAKIQNIEDDLDKDIPAVVSKQVNDLIRESIDLNDYQFLAPMYKTEYGINWLNNLIQKLYHNIPLEVDEKNINKWLDGKKTNNQIIAVGDKVLFTKNNPDTDTTNGETGIVKQMVFDKASKNANKVKFTIIHSFVKNEDIMFKGEDIFKDLTLGYAVSIHKSQGSEYQKVFVVFDTGGTDFLDKRNVYTAITRSKKELYITGNSDDLVRTIKKQPHKRNTYMLPMLINERQQMKNNSKTIETKLGKMSEDDLLDMLLGD